jgi:hypothetical protein
MTFDGWQLEATVSAHEVPSEMPATWEPDQMPWTSDDAERHTHRATTWALRELWAKVANECLERTGDEGRVSRELMILGYRVTSR